MKEQSGLYYKLIALWVLSEAMLGGIIHGFRIPVSGLIVGSAAVICICLIAYYIPSKGAILKATIIVAVFKMMLSPQSPPPAYIAVFFQGFFGELIFLNRRFYKTGCLLLGTIALIESGLQRIIVLTIVYGNDLWNAVNVFINGLTRQKEMTNYSFYFAGIYVLLHLIVGLIVGRLAATLPGKIGQWSLLYKENIIIPEQINQLPLATKGKKKNYFKKSLFFIWIIFLGLYLQSYFEIGKPLLPSHLSLKIFVRSVIIILTWYFLARPLVRSFLVKWLEKKRSQSQRDIEQILEILPSTRHIIAASWQMSEGHKGLRRIIHCCKIILVNTLKRESG